MASRRGGKAYMKVLVIPDVHLKPWMFQRASELMKETETDRVVCLLIDSSYEQTIKGLLD